LRLLLTQFFWPLDLVLTAIWSSVAASLFLRMTCGSRVGTVLFDFFLTCVVTSLILVSSASVSSLLAFPLGALSCGNARRQS
jgi:hypothetical protein